MKAKSAKEALELKHIPNVGPATIKDLQVLGITQPQQLKGKDGLLLYKKLNKLSGVRHDPCAADMFMAIVDFMNGGKPRPWWDFTEKRKQLLK
jgi:hypothetical protein